MRIAVLGAGAWGTAIAVSLAGRRSVVLQARDPALAREMQSTRANRRYLPGISLPSELTVTADFDAAVAHAEGGLLIVATPTRALRELCAGLAKTATRSPFVWLCKGLEEGKQLLAHEVVAQSWPDGANRGGPLSGPSFAFEVAQGLPTALTVAGSPELCEEVTAALHGDALRIYSSPDVIGVEIGGTVKNVLAIATGISDALQLGMNARAALITRGLAEMSRLGVALGAQAETFMGLTGLGDLILTATGDLSRNRQVGLALGRGRSLDQTIGELGHVAEGVRSAEAVLGRARSRGVQMPITEVVCAVLGGRLTATRALDRLLARDPKSENE